MNKTFETLLRTEDVSFEDLGNALRDAVKNGEPIPPDVLRIIASVLINWEKPRDDGTYVHRLDEREGDQ